MGVSLIIYREFFLMWESVGTDSLREPLLDFRGTAGFDFTTMDLFFRPWGHRFTVAMAPSACLVGQVCLQLKS